MASKASSKLYQTYPMLKQGVRQAQREIFAQFPDTGVRSGYQKSKKAMTGVYLDRYYTEPIDKIARKVCAVTCSNVYFWHFMLLLNSSLFDF